MDLRTGAAFIGQARTEIQCAPRTAPARERRSFFSILALPLAGALAAAMATVVIYQNAVTVPGLRAEVASANAPAALTATSLVGGATRGAELPTVKVSAGQPLFLNVDVPTDDRFSTYRVSFYDPAGSRSGTIDVSPDQAKNTLLLRFPGREIHSGIYTLAVEGIQASGAPADKLAQYRFQVVNGN